MKPVRLPGFVIFAPSPIIPYLESISDGVLNASMTKTWRSRSCDFEPDLLSDGYDILASLAISRICNELPLPCPH